MKMVIGLDVHSKKTVYVAQNQEGEQIARGSIPTNAEGFAQMIEHLQPPDNTTVGLEAGTGMVWIVEALRQHGLKPEVLDTREVRVYARRIGQKSDYRDAWEICDGLRRDLYRKRVFVPDSVQARLRMLISRRRHFVKMATAEINATKHLLRQHGLNNLAKSLTTTPAWQKLLAKLPNQEMVECVTLHYELWKVSQKNADTLKKRIKQASKPYQKEVQRLQTMPGIGVITAAGFVAAVGDPHRFPSSGALASYLGLTPSTFDSGEREQHGSITKRGPSYLRGLLCEVAKHARRAKHPLNPYWRRKMAGQGNENKATVAIAHRMARILWRMWRDEKDFDINCLNVVYDPRLVKRMQYFRIAD